MGMKKQVAYGTYDDVLFCRLEKDAFIEDNLRLVVELFSELHKSN